MHITPHERAEKKTGEISSRVLSANFRVTPAMRQKVDDLAVWLAAGDRRKIAGAKRAVIDLLCTAARHPGADRLVPMK
ncbi:MAG TPA: hypothetical protein VE981_04020 [Planctomycetota bacterium]|nr:hypothetical protein [Planctomycetota bacterium]